MINVLELLIIANILALIINRSKMFEEITSAYVCFVYVSSFQHFKWMVMALLKKIFGYPFFEFCLMSLKLQLLTLQSRVVVYDDDET